MSNPKLFGGYTDDELKGGTAHIYTDVTLRDLFAMAALTGLVQVERPLYYDIAIRKAWELADAMLATRTGVNP